MIDAESFDILDQIRVRAGLQPLTRASITTQALLREAIERKGGWNWLLKTIVGMTGTKKVVDVINSHGRK